MRMSTADRPAPAQEAVFAPGLRVEIRDAEWVIKRADLTSNGISIVLSTHVEDLAAAMLAKKREPKLTDGKRRYRTFGDRMPKRRG
jgi:hypothetical protein